MIKMFRHNATFVAVDDGVALLDRELGALAVVEQLARPGRDDLALDRFFFRRLGQVDPRLGHRLTLDRRDQHAVF